MSNLLKKKHISFEGNISAGKSTIFNYIKTLNLVNTSFVDEPVSEWENIKDKNGMNALECFYSDQKKNSFCFQVLAYITRLKKIIDTIRINPSNITISERCIETDKYVFAKMLYEADNISSIEWETYNYWYNTFVEISQVDMIIYIATDPEICYNRIKNRNRSGESNIPLEYLIKCHTMHENWINTTSTHVIKLNGNKNIIELQNDIKEIMNSLIPGRTESVITSN